MNTQTLDILNILLSNEIKTQRKLAKQSNISLGAVNNALAELRNNKLINDELKPTESAFDLAAKTEPKRAVILAAGIGLRMSPINLTTPKAFLEVNGIPLIERLINQVKEKEIEEIYIIVGFKKECFDYLIDKYGVTLIVNKDYAEKNNLHSLKLAAEHLSNCYIVPADLYCSKNPFNKNEFYSWYMVNDVINEYSTVRVTRSMELVLSKGGNSMVGISYITSDDCNNLIENINLLCSNKAYDNYFWEQALYNLNNKKLNVYAKLVKHTDVIEINTYEQLRDLDNKSRQLDSDALTLAALKLKVHNEDITNIRALKKGMTNRSFLFTCKNKNYIMRIPGEGTEQLINRNEEAAVYNIISDKNICDNIIYINPENGYKITEFIEDARCCDPFSKDDVLHCMKRLRDFHNLKLKVNHTFDLFGKIEFYESLWNGKPSLYRDYIETKNKVLSLRKIIEDNKAEFVLTHIDAVPDNFLITENNGVENIRLIDWEYAAMQDPHVDLAMFCIYALYDREHVDALIDSYFTEGYDKNTRIKIYCYIAVCGLLWSNWCEYKSQLGVEFGEYSLRQYRFAKDYYKIVQEELKK